ncbi:phosphoribosylformylglycinamidine synthase subunit PurS [uncultured Limosilactobacillus sp.]|uniref:phosphoribosylformylglycinamidine synthase subunit PurS n=1 Tax=uncultured Limosilactobacillus sp. TaxID=2837629 RepID=UPI0025FFA162|nr:phosphoribosylformylglycinamidine synthase subunit PurS [uncultured Limosilactobacillus sp.]
MIKVRVFVNYKQSVFDPQGDTITKTVHTIGHSEVASIQVGKFFDLQLKTTADHVDAIVKDIATNLLVNFNMETYTYQLLED